MTRKCLTIALGAIFALSLAACGGGNQNANATASPSDSAVATPVATASPDPNSALTVVLTSGTVVGTPAPGGKEPVRLVYSITVAAPNGTATAYGNADLPFVTKQDCDNDSVPIEEHESLQHGATVQRTAILYCTASGASDVVRDSGDSLNFQASAVTYQ